MVREHDVTLQKQEAEDRLVDAVAGLHKAFGTAVTASVLANTLIHLAENFTKAHGEDPKKQITLEGEGARTIVIQEDKS